MFINRAESLMPYLPGTSHRHFFEISQQINKNTDSAIPFTFTPHLAPLTQGILSTIHIPLEPHDVTRAEEGLYTQYLNDYFVSVFPSDISHANTSQVVRTNHAHISTHKENNMLIVFCAIDNLWKGAVGQAIQNFNIRFGYEEHTGLI